MCQLSLGCDHERVLKKLYVQCLAGKNRKDEEWGGEFVDIVTLDVCKINKSMK